MGKLKGLMTTCLTAAALCMLPLPTLAQTLLEAGKTDVGVLYIDSESVSTVKKDGKYYLAFFTEEKYTDEAFLAALRQGEDMSRTLQAALACICLILSEASILLAQAMWWMRKVKFVQTLVQIPYRRMQGAIKLCATLTPWRLKYYSAKRRAVKGRQTA